MKNLKLKILISLISISPTIALAGGWEEIVYISKPGETKVQSVIKAMNLCSEAGGEAGNSIDIKQIESDQGGAPSYKVTLECGIH